MYRKSVKRFKKRKFCNIEWFLISFWIVSIIKLGSNIQGKPTSYFFSVLMNYSWTKTLVQEQFAWNLSSCLTKIWISPTLQVGWSGLPKHQLMLDFIFPPNLSELPFLVIPMILAGALPPHPLHSHLAWVDFRIKVKQIAHSIVHFDQWNKLISKM